MISLIIGVNGNCGIAEHGLGTGGRKLQKFRGRRLSVLVYKRVLDVPEMSCLFLVFNLGIGNGGIAYRAPVDDT